MRASVSPGSEIPRFVPAYPRSSGIFAKSEKNISSNYISSNTCAKFHAETLPNQCTRNTRSENVSLPCSAKRIERDILPRP